MKKISRFPLMLLAFFILPAISIADTLRGTGDLGVIIERTSGAVQIIETTHNTSLGRVKGLGDLSHASVVFSRDERYAYVFGRDGGLSKIDLLKKKIVKRVMQSGNSIGGAISQNGKLVAVSNYKPGGVKVFDAQSLKLIADIPAEYTAADGSKKLSKVIGLVDAPGNRFVFSLWDAGEIWIADMHDAAHPKITRFNNIGRNPYDGLITPDGRYYIAGLFGEDGMAMLDLWHPEKGISHILPDYGKGDKKLPVYKMPHLEGWAVAGHYAFVPAVGHHEVLVIDLLNWKQVAKIPVFGQPVFVMAQPDGRRVWVNFAVPNNHKVQIIDTESLKLIKTLEPGKGVLHMEFEPRGEEVWISVRDKNQVQVYDTETLNINTRLNAIKPSGIFNTARAHKLGL